MSQLSLGPSHSFLFVFVPCGHHRFLCTWAVFCVACVCSFLIAPPLLSSFSIRKSNHHLEKATDVERKKYRSEVDPLSPTHQPHIVQVHKYKLFGAGTREEMRRGLGIKSRAQLLKEHEFEMAMQVKYGKAQENNMQPPKPDIPGIEVAE